MTMPSEHAEADALFQAQEQRQLLAMDVTRDNAASMTEVNRAGVKFAESWAVLRHRFAAVVAWGAVLAVAWSAWAMVHWA